MWELLLYADWGGLFTPSVTRDLRRTERRVAAAAKRAIRDSCFSSWACMPDLETLPIRKAEDRLASKFLARLADPAKATVPAHNVTLVVTRPGDETLAC